MKLYQPYPRLSPVYFPQFLAEKKQYFISQSYPRGEVKRWGEEPKIPLAFSLYKDKGVAQMHLSVVKADNYAAFIDMENPAHMEKITAMMQPGSRYDVFGAMVWKADENERYIKQHYSRHIERFTSSKGWHIPKSDTAGFVFKIIFGQPHLNIRWRNNEVEVHFDEIEKA